ncbi:MAG: alpha/beta fold hydrolase [Bdellovibrionales bacterium]|nr:alpha/beta fold hydrolase [Bdellovibrionales bacterium]
MGGLKLALKFVCFALVTIQVLAYFFQERLIFFPEKLPADFPLRFEGATEISIPVDGAILSALRFRVKNPRGIIVYFHGNAGSLSGWGDEGTMHAALGFDVLIYDYRGYGKSTGRISSEDQLVNDARAVLAEARKDFPDSKIVLFGRSLGTGLAVRLASEMKPALLILETPYLSLASIGRARFPVVLPFLVRYPMRSDLYAPKVTAPTIILHGTDDEVVPFVSGAALAERFTPPADLVKFPGGHHSDLSVFPGYRPTLERSLTVVPR